MTGADYSVFDKFLAVETWHTSHPLDDKRFFLCLHEIVDLPDFSAQAMGKHMRVAKGVDSHDHHYAQRIDDLVSKAYAVRDYLKATGVGKDSR